MLPHLHAYFSSAHDCLRGSSQLLASYGHHERSLGAGLLAGSSHKPVDKFFHDHLARKRLRDFDHRCEIELFDRCLDRAGRARRALVLPQPRMEFVELSHLAVGAPTEIAPPRVSQVEMRDLLETARGVKVGSQFVGERLMMDEAACAC